MENIIKILPDSVANQIAAGEVIQRPSSVVKELMENALDAGASKIEVRIKDAGRSLIQVIDDGKGMSPEDARIAFERHSTSKLRNASDLFHLKTMGFRGEALASIASVAQVELVTRRAQDELSWKVEIEGSVIVNEEPTLSAQGSRFSVRNLFYNVPARRKFLGDNVKELKNIREEFIQIALVNTEVEMMLFHNDEQIYHLFPGNNKQRISTIFGKRSGGQLIKQLYPVDVETQIINISGFVGDPNAACQREALQYFFVNGRFIRHKFFRNSILKAYETLIPSGSQPVFFIYLNVDPQALDVNIHPTKTEVKFEHEQAIWPIIHATVREALGKFNAVPSIDFDKDDAPEIRVYSGDKAVSAPKLNFNSSYNPFGSNTKNHTTNWESLYDGFQKENSSESISYFSPDEINENLAENKTLFENESGYESFTDLRFNIDDPKFQLFKRYVVIKNEKYLIMINQQRAHLRILYDKYIKQFDLHKGLSQTLMFPETLYLDNEQKYLFLELMDELQTLGFGFNMDGEDVLITSIPVDTHSKNPEDLILDLIGLSKELKNQSKKVLSEKFALKMSKYIAIPEGQILGIEEMESLVNELIECKEYKYTPEGKLIVSIVTPEDVRNFFES
jgi:DNA mismatch repair protein MutL